MRNEEKKALKTLIIGILVAIVIGILFASWITGMTKQASAIMNEEPTIVTIYDAERAYLTVDGIPLFAEPQ